MWERWGGVPRPVGVGAAAAVAVFGYGTAVHVVQLAGGGTDPYPWAPPWLAAYFVALTVLDPLAAVLLALRRAGGLALGVGVLVTDAVANGYATYVLHAGGTAARAGQAVISVLAVALLAAWPRLRPWLTPVDAPPP